MKFLILIPCVWCLSLFWMPANAQSAPAPKADPPAKTAVPDPDGDDASSPGEKLAKHREGAARIADEQDELKADVQQLIVEQTMPKVVELLSEVEDIMNETTDLLSDADTGGETIAAQTEIIEKIHAAAKQRQSEGGSGKSGGAMMDMMERMMGKQSGGQPKPGGQAGEGTEGGKGQTGLSDAANDPTGGNPDGKTGERRIPKAAGTAGREIPEEFKNAFDAYNRGAEKKAK